MPRRLTVLLICWSTGTAWGFAQAAESAGAPPPTANAAVRLTLPPLPKPQVSYFRELLALGPTELEKALADIPVTAREKLRAKLQEYAALTPEEREARLRATELRWYLGPLMRTPPTNRIAQLTIVPDEFRRLVEERLKRWDALPPEIQNEVLENEWTIHYFLQLKSASPSQRKNILNNLTAAQRTKLDQQLGSWLALPPDKRQRMCDRFQQFFELPPQEKERTLDEFPEAERKAMEKTLRDFERLPPAQRAICINSFRKFVGMTPEERVQFLINVERWKQMSADDRETWRSLVAKLPPLPPGFGNPPLPPGFRRERTNAPVPPLPSTTINLTNAGK